MPLGILVSSHHIVASLSAMPASWLGTTNYTARRQLGSVPSNPADRRRRVSKYDTRDLEEPAGGATAAATSCL